VNDVGPCNHSVGDTCPHPAAIPRTCTPCATGEVRYSLHHRHQHPWQRHAHVLASTCTASSSRSCGPTQQQRTHGCAPAVRDTTPGPYNKQAPTAAALQTCVVTWCALLAGQPCLALEFRAPSILCNQSQVTFPQQHGTLSRVGGMGQGTQL
jgi:hypothetical protein